jgi:hypothetical protein
VVRTRRKAAAVEIDIKPQFAHRRD